MWPETREKVNIEIEHLHKQIEYHRILLQKVSHSDPDPVDLSALSALLHAFYTGIENIFTRIAVEIDGVRLSGDRSHTDLLTKMAKATAKHPAVISNSLYVETIKYMQFRHVFRHAYTFDLKWRKMSELVFHCEEVLEHLETELTDFFDSSGQGS